MTRKGFLLGAAAVSTRLAFGQAKDRKLKLGIIGSGWWAGINMNAAWQVGNCECVAICDVDSKQAELFTSECEKKQGSKPKIYKDYRELLDHSGLDAVIVTTQPHWHALQYIDICKKGLPCYLEKPLAYDIKEGQAMVAAWKKAGNLTQVGFQRRQKNGFAMAKEFIKSGQAGKIIQVDAQIHYRAGTPDRVMKDPPATLDWETWVGPAVKLPYSDAYGHRTWRLEKEYGNGHLVDWGVHLIDGVRNIMELDWPKTVQATGGLFEYAGKITTPDTMTATWEFEQLPLIWRHRIWGSAEYTPEVNNGVFLYGEKATVFATDGKWAVIPRDTKTGKREEWSVVESKDQSMSHMAELLNGIRDGKKPSCTPEDAAKSTATVQLAMIAYHTGAKLAFDGAAVKVTNHVEANKMLKREYRKGWKHPG
jgi:predicted dehydrogenase